MYYKLLNFLVTIFIIGCDSNKSIPIGMMDNLRDLHNEAKILLEKTLFQMEDEYFVRDVYGLNESPFTGNIYFCSYIHIDTEYNCKIFSISDGEVIEIGFNDFMGRFIKIKYNDIEIEYGLFFNFQVNVGDIVSIGDIIGYGGVGGMGTSFGTGIRIRINYKGNYLNPSLLLNYDNKRHNSDTITG
jgi:murein DD-endopeptidase MepM/ murein hydrolase activator NlpD